MNDKTTQIEPELPELPTDEEIENRVYQAFGHYLSDLQFEVIKGLMRAYALSAIAADRAKRDPVGWIHGDEFYFAGDPTLNDHIRENGRAVYDRPAPVAAGLSDEEILKTFDREGLAVDAMERGDVKAILASVRALEARMRVPELISVKDRLPPFGKDLRVLIYTEGSDFAGEQFFDVKADHLNDAYWEDEADMPEVCKHATHWMLLPYPAIAAAPTPTNSDLERHKKEPGQEEG